MKSGATTNTISPGTLTAFEGVHDKLLSLIYRQTIRSALPICVVNLMITVLLYRTQPLNSILIWVCLSIAYVSVHIVIFTLIKKNPVLSVKKKLAYVSLLTVIGGSILASCLIFFNDLPVIDRTMLTITLLAIAAGSIGAFAGYQPLYWCFVVPIVVPLSILWFVDITADIDVVLKVWIGALLLVIIGTLATIGQDTFDFFAGSIKNMQEKDQLTSELIDALEQQEILKLKAEQSNQSKTRLLASVSHDLRQPVHVLNLFGTALKHTQLDDDTQQIVNDMNQAILDLSRQINVILDITKLDEISYKPTITVLCISEQMAIIAHTHRAEIADRGLTLRIFCEQNLCVMSDQQLLTQIVRNLVGNAIKYTTDGYITLSAKSDGDDVLLSIADTGIGIEQDKLNTIFEEHYQIDNPERNQQKGFGLGLSIVKRAADILNHSVEVQSVVGAGSTFTIRIKQELSVKHALLNPIEQTMVTLQPKSVRPRVHVIDDDLMNCKSIRSALEALGCNVSTTQSTEATSEYFSLHESPELFIIDIRLQGADSGFTTHQYIKAFHPHAKSVFMSGELDSLHKAQNHSNIPMIQKPVSGDQLVKLVNDIDVDVDVDVQTTAEV